MINCDYAISGDGSTLYECGIPTLCFSFAKNQVVSVETFASQKCMISIGQWQKKLKVKMKEKLSAMISNYELKQLLQKNMC